MNETNGLMKLSSVDLIETLREVVSSNTRYYLTDFVYDVRQLRQAPPQNYLFMSRMCGTYLFPVQDILLRDTYDYNSWIHYSPKEVLAFFVQVEKTSKRIATGSLYQLDYPEAVEWTKKNALPVNAAHLTFSDGRKEVVPVEQLSSFYPPGDVARVRYLPGESEELEIREIFLQASARLSTEETTPEQFRNRLLAHALQHSGYPGRDMYPIPDDRIRTLLKKGFALFRLGPDGAEKATSEQIKEDWRSYKNYPYAIRMEDKPDYDSLDRAIIGQGVREQIRERKQKEKAQKGWYR